MPGADGEKMRMEKAGRVGVGVLVLGACGFGVARAQKKVHVDRPIIEARAEDVGTIENLGDYLTSVLSENPLV